ncbi:hypothetical protein EV424DRAFT_1347958 [Suillus variegatus]|nr:hypothetical protein EV424DRAFT_1347958 [Suillus variegatus]
MPPRWKNTSRVAPITAAPVAAIPTAAPVAATPATATPAAAPIAAAVNATMLQNPPRRCQPPVRFRDNGASPSRTADEGESFHFENISGDEEDEVANPPVLTATPVVGPTPLQTAMNTARTDPLATDRTLSLSLGSAKPASCRAHAFNEHTNIYLEEAERQHWHVHTSSCLKTFLDDGWTITTLHQRLKDPAYTLDSLGTPPTPSSLPGTSLSAPDDVLSDFTLDEMHKQIVKFIVADDQAISIIECPEFRHLIRLLRPSLNETNLFHRTKVCELVIDAFHEYFNALKKDLANLAAIRP